MTNTSIRNGQKLNTKYTLQNTSPSPNPYPSRASGGCNFNKLTTSAVKCTTKMVVPGTKIGDSLKVNLPASASLASLLDWSFCVTYRAPIKLLYQTEEILSKHRREKEK